MYYVLKVVEGILQAFGIIIGFVIAIVWFMHKAKPDASYAAEDLLQPFTNYLDKILEEQQYDQVALVKNIIVDLTRGKVPEDIKQFKIKHDTSIQLKDQDGNTTLRMITGYIVVKRIDTLKQR